MKRSRRIRAFSAELHGLNHGDGLHGHILRDAQIMGALFQHHLGLLQRRHLETTWRTIVNGIEETRQIQENAKKQREEDQKRLSRGIQVKIGTRVKTVDIPAQAYQNILELMQNRREKWA